MTTDFKEIYCKGEFYNFENIYIFNKDIHSNEVKCFTVAGFDSQENLDRVVELLNGCSTEYFLNAEVLNDNITIELDGGRIKLVTRGWGHLTGTLRLSHKEAVEIQDGFIVWCCKKLTGGNE